MADLTFAERNIFETFITGENGAGYVLDFNDRTFKEFVGETTGIEIDEDRYRVNGTSKANRLRTFYKIESDYNVGTLFIKLHEYKLAYIARKDKPYNQLEFDQFIKISNRLLKGRIIENIDAIKANNTDKDFNQLARLIKESIEKNEPEAALDRLHTFVIKFLKELCKSHAIDLSKDDTVIALFGKYIKAIKTKNLIQSSMAEKIVQFSFQIMDAFNDIRNNRSFAHDNPILDYDESVLIFSNVTSMVKCIQSIESRHNNKVIEQAKPSWNDFK
ncbi:MAG TPA: hypothetical protein DCS36_00540 [Sphingobacterium sp.]|nr:hypothetical protein [Sphingobacterium sp.]